MAYELINQLTESRLITTKQRLSKYNLRDMADLTFLYFLGLQILYDEPSTHEFAKFYARKTIMFSNFNNFTYAGTDLYIFLHILTGNNADISRRLLKNDQQNNELSKLMQPRLNTFKQYLVFIYNDRLNDAMIRRNLLTVQKELAIVVQNYRSMRTLVSQWHNISVSNKRLTMTRLLQALRLRARTSELLPELEKLAIRLNLELKDVRNAEADRTTKKVKEKPDGAPWWIKTAAAAGGYALARKRK